MNLPQVVAGSTIALWTRVVRRWSGSGFLLSPKLQWNSGLHGICLELETLNRSTEEEFLSMGASLQGFTQRARELSTLCSTASSLLSGSDMMAAMEGFNSIHHRVAHLENGFHQNRETLESVLHKLEHLETLLNGFTNIVRELSALCVSMKIESVRLGERDLGFAVLSEEVKKLAHEIAEKRGQLLERTKVLTASMERISARVLVLESSRKDQAGMILDRSQAGMASLKEKNDSSASFARSTSQRFETLSRSIGEIVMSLQFHDITRQRIEHVISAVMPLAPSPTAPPLTTAQGEEGAPVTSSGGHGEPADKAGGCGEAQEDYGLASDICSLQAAQLIHAKDELLMAIGRIKTNLQEVGSQMAAMSLEIQGAAGSAEEGGSSFFEEIESNFKGFRSTLDSYSTVSGELCLAMDSVGCMVGDMSEFAGVIEGIGLKIKLIALNAIVKAAHMGEEGVSLGVLADGIHRLSVKTCLHTADVVAVLHAMTTSMTSLQTRDGNEVETRQDVPTEVERQTDVILSTLRGLKEQVALLMVRMDEEGRSLSEDIADAVAEMGTGDRVDEAVHKAVSELQKTADLLDSMIPASEQSRRARNLMDLEATYTMQGERQVHASLLGAGAAAADFDGREGLGAGDHEPELFDTDIEMFCPDFPILPAESEEPIPCASALREGVEDCLAELPGEGQVASEPDEDLGDNVELF